jgi:presenilin enhancer 2
LSNYINVSADEIDHTYSIESIASDKTMVSLSKKSPEERLNICRKYYTGKKKRNFFLFHIFFRTAGFAFLPLLWLINAIWFYKQAFKVEPYPQQAQIRTCK